MNYIWTMYHNLSLRHEMSSVAVSKMLLIIADRQNPIEGVCLPVAPTILVND